MSSRLALSLILAAPVLPAAEIDVSGTSYRTDAQTQISINGDPVQATSLPSLRGLRAQLQARPGMRGAAPLLDQLRFDFSALGPVTAVQPLRVLGQEVTATAQTVLVNLATVAQLQTGMFVAASGHIDPNGSMLATALIREPTGPGSWRLTGIASAVGPGAEFRIGPQRVSLAGVDLAMCPGGPVVGAFVDLRATPIAGFGAASVLDTVQRLSCGTPVAFGTPGAAGALEGVIGEPVLAGSFQLGGLGIDHDAATVFQFGAADELAGGVRVEMEGSFTAIDRFHADSIALVRPVLRFEGPVAAADVIPGESIRVLGATVRRSAQLRDEDGIQSGGLGAATQVEVRGYLDTAGLMWSTRVRERGNPDAGDVRVRGAASQIAAPLFQLFHVTVDTTGASLVGMAGEPLDAPGFFSQLTPGLVVDVAGAVWQPAQQRVSGGVITLIAPDVPPVQTRGSTGVQTGIVRTSSVGPLLFGDGLETAIPTP